ncbi:protease HtpX [Filobacillus milosensis]|uniref:Protease HtpX homolog n=1 Tax=Filobacillus milosensis TaxID=94137 RepID=A0A4Y8INL8_9BACI|nr:protease HtpX [Filobacillus milosensis]TFB22929.1 protease HtpX [Filobacillus milosensis]
MGKRIFYFILTNILVMTTIMIVWSVITSFFDIGRVGGYGGLETLDIGALAIFSIVVGFTGAFISLAMSRWMAKKMMGVRVIDPSKNMSAHERELVEKVHRLSRAAGLMHMPEVGIYNSREVNAFATGPSKKKSLVAVSAGLLQSMDDDAVEGVLAHEIAHVANGDMVTMTLLQGVVNTFVVFLSRIVASIVSGFVREEMRFIVHFAAVIIFQILFSILGSLVVFAYSRYREYHADRGGADLAGKDKMIHALESLKRQVNNVRDPHQDDNAVQTLKINNKRSTNMFSSHPDLDDRIARLRAK